MYVPPGLPPLYWLLLIALVGAYLLPTFVAYSRRHPRRRAIALLNVLTGWTGTSWVETLAISLSKKDLPPSR